MLRAVALLLLSTATAHQCSYTTGIMQTVEGGKLGGEMEARTHDSVREKFTALFSDYLTDTAGKKLQKLTNCPSPVAFKIMPIIVADSLDLQRSSSFADSGVDFAYLPHVATSCYSDEFQLSPILRAVTTTSGLPTDPYAEVLVGSIFLARRQDPSIDKLKDLHGKRIASTHHGSVADWLLASELLQQLGVYIPHEAQQVIFYGLGDSAPRQCLQSVLSGTADVCVLASSTVASLFDSGALDASAFKYVEPSSCLAVTGDKQPQIHTRLVVQSEYVLSVMPDVHWEVAREVIQALSYFNSSDVWAQKATILSFTFTEQTRWHSLNQILRDMSVLRRDPVSNVWSCDFVSIAPTITCPPSPSLHRKSETAIRSACQRKDLPCPGQWCVCSPCGDLSNAEVFLTIGPAPPEDLEASASSMTAAYTRNGGSNASWSTEHCHKMTVCASARIGQTVYLRLVDTDNEFGEHVIVTYIIMQQALVNEEGNSALTGGARYVDATPAHYLSTFTVLSRGTSLLHVFVNGTELSSSPTLLSVVGPQCGPGSADEAGLGRCECLAHYYDIGGTCVSMSTLLPSAFVPGILLMLLLLYLYGRRKRANTNPWAIEVSDVIFHEPTHVLGQGTFGYVVAAQYKGLVVDVAHARRASKARQVAPKGSVSSLTKGMTTSETASRMATSPRAGGATPQDTGSEPVEPPSSQLVSRTSSNMHHLCSPMPAVGSCLGCKYAATTNPRAQSAESSGDPADSAAMSDAAKHLLSCPAAAGGGGPRASSGSTNNNGLPPRSVSARAANSSFDIRWPNVSFDVNKWGASVSFDAKSGACSSFDTVARSVSAGRLSSCSSDFGLVAARSASGGSGCSDLQRTSSSANPRALTKTFSLPTSALSKEPPPSSNPPIGFWSHSVVPVPASLTPPTLSPLSLGEDNNQDLCEQGLASRACQPGQQHNERLPSQSRNSRGVSGSGMSSSDSGCLQLELGPLGSKGHRNHSADLNRYSIKTDTSILDSKDSRKHRPSSLISLDLVRRMLLFPKQGEPPSRSRLWDDFISQMKVVSKLRHPNIMTIMGAMAFKTKEPILVMELMQNGSLYDVLHNDTIALEEDVIVPMLRDIVGGVIFLYASNPPIMHGEIRARSILIDSSFRAKLSDFGFDAKQKLCLTYGPTPHSAPEVLLGGARDQSSDVYSFGVVMWEMLTRRDPYEDIEVDEWVERVCQPPKDGEEPYRPVVPAICPSEYRRVMSQCWLHEASARLPLPELLRQIECLELVGVEPFVGRTRSPLDAQLQATNNVLFDVFPKHVAEALIAGRKVEPEKKECVSIFFSDIVGFTVLSQSMDASAVSDMLDRLYSKFDALSRDFNVFKVETIGDAFIACTNLVEDQPDHAARLAQFAVAALEATSKTLVDEANPGKGPVQIRVGMHSGPVVASVIGTRKKKYCLLGDTVNTASRMESTGQAGRIQVSRKTAKLIRKQAPWIQFENRGVIEVKGKGMMHTYWVTGAIRKDKKYAHAGTACSDHQAMAAAAGADVYCSTEPGAPMCSMYPPCLRLTPEEVRSEAVLTSSWKCEGGDLNMQAAGAGAQQPAADWPNDPSSMSLNIYIKRIRQGMIDKLSGSQQSVGTQELSIGTSVDDCSPEAESDEHAPPPSGAKANPPTYPRPAGLSPVTGSSQHRSMHQSRESFPSLDSLNSITDSNTHEVPGLSKRLSLGGSPCRSAGVRSSPSLSPGCLEPPPPLFATAVNSKLSSPLLVRGSDSGDNNVKEGHLRKTHLKSHLRLGPSSPALHPLPRHKQRWGLSVDISKTTLSSSPTRTAQDAAATSTSQYGGTVLTHDSAAGSQHEGTFSTSQLASSPYTDMPKSSKSAPAVAADWGRDSTRRSMHRITSHNSSCFGSSTNPSICSPTSLRDGSHLMLGSPASAEHPYRPFPPEGTHHSHVSSGLDNSQQANSKSSEETQMSGQPNSPNSSSGNSKAQSPTETKLSNPSRTAKGLETPLSFLLFNKLNLQMHGMRSTPKNNPHSRRGSSLLLSTSAGASSPCGSSKGTPLTQSPKARSIIKLFGFEGAFRSILTPRAATRPTTPLQEDVQVGVFDSSDSESSLQESGDADHTKHFDAGGEGTCALHSDGGMPSFDSQGAREGGSGSCSVHGKSQSFDSVL